MTLRVACYSSFCLQLGSTCAVPGKRGPLASIASKSSCRFDGTFFPRHPPTDPYILHDKIALRNLIAVYVSKKVQIP